MAKVIGIELPILKNIKATMKRFLVILPLEAQDIPDIEKLWETTKWVEIENIEDEQYEVEKITKTAGVRGDEAKNEILSYLYYVTSSKTGENSLKVHTP